MKYAANTIKNHDTYTKGGLARPINYRVDTILERICHAYGVLTGKYDALDWQDKGE